MEKSIFEYRDYKRFLKDYLSAQPKGGRGLRSELARVSQTKTTYVSSVLNAQAHFNQEQALRIAQFLGLSQKQSHYFLLLLNYARAGSKELRQFYEQEIQQAQEKSVVIQDRLKQKTVLGPEEQAIYYSAWYYAAVHMALTVDSLRSPEALARHFKLPLKLIQNVLEFLESVGLAQRQTQGFVPGQSYLHLGRDSPYLLKHHSNWRLKAIQSVELNRKSDLHYSAAVTLSKEDSIQVKEVLVQAIEKAQKRIAESPAEEELCALCMDFFSLGE